MPGPISRNKPQRQWADKYGPQWYLHKDGRPPLDDDNSYYWTGHHWARDFDFDDEIDEAALEAWEERRREKIAIANEF